MSVACVVLTMGDRPEALDRALRSVLDQQTPAGNDLDVLVIANGCGPVAVPAGVRTEVLETNLGIPGGRNQGVRRTTADVLLFLDDDGYFPSTDAVAGALEQLEADPGLGILSFQVVDSEGGAGQRRHVPRLRAGDPERSSEVTTFLGGACAIRRAVFDSCGEYADEFFFGHEESDLAWRAIDEGFRIRYVAEITMAHASRAPAAGGDALRLNARNRVWLVRRRLPWTVALLHLSVWTLITVARLRRPAVIATYLAGLRQGWTTPAGERRPIRWSTVWRMTRLGRPPIL